MSQLRKQHIIVRLTALSTWEWREKQWRNARHEAAVDDFKALLNSDGNNNMI
jgi:hypothetical protein